MPQFAVGLRAYSYTTMDLDIFQVVIGAKVGRAKHMRIMPGGALEAEQSLSGPSSVFVGQKLDDHRGAFLLEYPMDKGHVVDGGWDAMESLWEVSSHRLWVLLNCNWFANCSDVHSTFIRNRI
jgi:hypothetical protein